MKKDKNVATGDFVEVQDTKKQNNDVKKEKKKNKKPNIFKRFGAKCKDVFSELKKVSWPTFAQVVKQTGIVLAVVLVFMVVIFGFDMGLSALLGLITP